MATVYNIMVTLLVQHVFASKSNDIRSCLCLFFLLFTLCRFPWGGEKCEQLIMSQWFYSIQVSCLVLSNLAMVPGIIYCYYCELSFLMVALTFAAMSSGFYHLCDTDTLCVAELSFYSLQVTNQF